MNTCRPDFARCGRLAVTEVRATYGGRASSWRPVCQAHALRFEEAVQARGYGFEHRPVVLLREVLDRPPADVIPIGRARGAA